MSELPDVYDIKINGVSYEATLGRYEDQSATLVTINGAGMELSVTVLDEELLEEKLSLSCENILSHLNVSKGELMFSTEYTSHVLVDGNEYLSFAEPYDLEVEEDAGPHDETSAGGDTQVNTVEEGSGQTVSPVRDVVASTSQDENKSRGTPVTVETFAAWKENKMKKLQSSDTKSEQIALTGRELYEKNPSLFDVDPNDPNVTSPGSGRLSPDDYSGVSRTRSSKEKRRRRKQARAEALAAASSSSEADRTFVLRRVAKSKSNPISTSPSGVREKADTTQSGSVPSVSPKSNDADCVDRENRKVDSNLAPRQSIDTDLENGLEARKRAREHPAEDTVKKEVPAGDALSQSMPVGDVSGSVSPVPQLTSTSFVSPLRWAYDLTNLDHDVSNVTSAALLGYKGVDLLAGPTTDSSRFASSRINGAKVLHNPSLKASTSRAMSPGLHGRGTHVVDPSPLAALNVSLSENTRTLHEVEMLRRRNAELEEALGTARAQVKEDSASRESHVQALTDQIEALQQRNQALSEEVPSLTHQLDQAKQTCSALEDRVSGLSETIRALQADQASVSERHDGELQNALKMQLQLEREHAALLQEKHDEVMKSRSEKSELEAYLDSFVSQQAQVSRDQTVLISRLQRQVERLQESVAGLEADKADLLERETSISGDRDDALARVTELEARVGELTAAHSAVDACFTALQTFRVTELQEAHEQIRQLQTELDDLNKAHTLRLKEVDQLQSRCSEYENQERRRAREAQLASAQEDEAIERFARRALLEDDISIDDPGHGDNAIESLRDEFVGAGSHAKTTVAELKAAKLERRLKQLRSVYDAKARDAQAERERDVSSLRRDLDAASLRVKDLEKEVSALQDALDSSKNELKVTVETLNKNMEGVEVAYDAEVRRLSDVHLRATIAAKQDFVQEMATVVQTKDVQIAELSKERAEARQATQRLEHIKARAEDALVSRTHDLNIRISELEASVEALNGDVAAKESECKARGNEKIKAQQKNAERRAKEQKQKDKGKNAKENKNQLVCPVCKATIGHKNMVKTHWDSKHSKLPIPAELQ